MLLIDTAIIATAALASSACALSWLLRPMQNLKAETIAPPGFGHEPVSMLFDGDMLQHATGSATRVLQLFLGREDWKSVRDRLIKRFPELPRSPELVPSGTSRIPSRHAEDLAQISLSRRGKFLKLVIVDKAGQIARRTEQLRAVESELNDLKRASDTTPHAIWQVDSDGKVCWYNEAYAKLFDRIHKSQVLADTEVFKTSGDILSEKGIERVSVQLPDQINKDWYDVTAVRSGDITIYHALNVNAVVKSEIAQRNFVQTLAKTFAQLSIGLAIFDRNGQLALFNPALIDLTALPADFLSGRPTLISFFDRIRENRRMPEPKNYSSWRQQITDVIAAATDGRYQETWTLESGQTYRVNGRPHPDGAIAFLIEDITAEISLTRNFRAELELGQSLLDSFDDALAVFSSAGILTFSNLAYRGMWGLDPENSFADVTIGDSVAEWEKQCQGNTRWQELTGFVLDFGEKAPWEMTVTQIEGRALLCSVSRIATGATIVRFSPIPAERLIPQI